VKAVLKDSKEFLHAPPIWYWRREQIWKFLTLQFCCLLRLRY